MLIEGLKLTFLGMLVVFAFLILLVMVVELSSKILKPLTDKEALAFASTEKKKSRLSKDKVNRRITSYNVCYTKLLRYVGAEVSFAGWIHT